MARSLIFSGLGDSYHEKLWQQIQSPEVPGTRHDEAKKLIPRLVWSGYSGEAIFSIMRGKYSDDFLDSEIWGIVRWAERNVTDRASTSFDSNFQGESWKPRRPNTYKPPVPAPQKINRDALRSVLSVVRLEEYDFFDASPIRLGEPKQDQYLFVYSLFKEGELVAIKPGYKLPDIVKSREEWLTYLEKNQAPCTEVGGWFRINPILPNHGKHICDRDIATHRFLLVEADDDQGKDDLSPKDQLKVLGSMIPYIGAITHTGGRSYHGLMKIDAQDKQNRTKKVEDYFKFLEPLGFDASNKNPSRLTRLANVYRTDPIKEVESWQRLIYLNPDPKPSTIFQGKIQ
jgi:hypothetical protein